VEVFDGNLHDQATVPGQIEKLRRRFSLSSVVLVCDRGMVTRANIELLGQHGVGFITALKAPQVAKLVEDGELQLSLFDQQNLAKITSMDSPGERLVVCRNPLVAAERSRKREELLAATERELTQIQQRVAAATLCGAAQIGLAVGAVANHWKVRKHLDIQITDTTLSFSRKHSQIDAEAALDGFYILRTGVSETELPTADVVRSYKQLNAVERGFRTLKGPELQIRPIHHRLEQRVPAHVFLYMLAYYLTWHLLEAWKPLLFTDEQPTPSPDPSPRPHAHLSTRESGCSSRVVGEVHRGSSMMMRAQQR
jgi:transposase